jgi:hypothetical protein
VWTTLGQVGVDVTQVAQVLEDEGVASFTKSFDQLISALDLKRSELAGR